MSVFCIKLLHNGDKLCVERYLLTSTVSFRHFLSSRAIATDSVSESIFTGFTKAWLHGSL